MQRTMQDHAGVFRFGDIKQGVTKILEVEKCQAHPDQGQVHGLEHRPYRSPGTGQPDRSRQGHHDLCRSPQGIPRCPRARRCADCAETPNGRDDKNWLKHTLWFSEGNRLDYKPVNLQPLTDVEPIALAKRTTERSGE
jgi:succinate dehydrogenase / fumarate reductase flavoprotein subunit